MQYFYYTLGGNDCWERKTEYVGSDLSITNNGQRNKVRMDINNSKGICLNTYCYK